VDNRLKVEVNDPPEKKLLMLIGVMVGDAVRDS
jgi:hypothetical protein